MDHLLLCNGAQYRVGATWIRQIHAIGSDVVPQTVTVWAKAKMDGYVARQQNGSVGGRSRVKEEPARGRTSQPSSGHVIAKHMPRHPKPKRLGTWTAAATAVVVQSPP